MKTYKSFQVCWTIFIILIPIIGFFVLIDFGILGNDPPPKNALLPGYALLLLIILLFYGLRIRLTDEVLILSFGIGLIYKKIPLNKITSTKIVRAKWYNGIGIRLIENGWLYNAHGLDAVELSFKNKKRILQVGSPEKDILKEEIDKRLTK